MSLLTGSEGQDICHFKAYDKMQSSRMKRALKTTFENEEALFPVRESERSRMYSHFPVSCAGSGAVQSIAYRSLL